MSIYRKPVIFIIVSLVVVLVGSVVSTFIPLFMPSMEPALEGITPYNPIELEGRDIYIREGCNNCHTQTVRPLLFETARYGEPSKLGEFVHDRPHLWGSKRTGPDLARVGGKYPDSWHYKHMENPQAMFKDSNMPPYAWLAGNRLDTSLAEKKMKTLHFPFADAEIRALDGKTEMDALVAYLQKLGRTKKPQPLAATTQGAATAVESPAVAEGHKIFDENCAGCHGADLAGGLGPNLTDAEWKFGGSDADLILSITEGRPGGMPSWKSVLDQDKTGKVVAYIRSRAKG
ncbi:MAG: cbb3-type cytochrome c oxidase subunit II [Nitrospirae bacterium]|nr:cbb3-type cytochrome c oxidase subunit II [Nitrospirota bacterium]